ncbi:tripartite tricarboxylate transporter TctB family protein [Geomicrobium sediminis]|uniref:Tricarboxylic transport membrane protein n=1 Tax=Geomicrobium sediminis TaxID=1347788 RepID=A0ABS2PG38_9BACL|nr:tripartite tricarboxylate transporter TctB family protein [Geomicrobium sediminis]MBM7634388.1 putative tricarboxylic transport membrane protein [Geomicrobium sediminis]
MKRLHANHIISLLLLVFAATAFIMAQSFTPSSGAAPGPAFFPQVLSVLLFILAIILAFQTPTDTDKKLNLNVVFIMIAFGVYVYLVEPIGFVVSTVIFTAGYLLLLGERRWYFIIPAAILLPLIVSYSFEHLLHVPIPHGLLY